MGRHTKEAERLAARLRALKCRAGVSYDVLARSTGLSRSTLHRYGTGRLPASFGHVLAFGRACGASQEELRELHTLWALATAGADAAHRDREAGGGPRSGAEGACVTESPGRPVPEEAPVVAQETRTGAETTAEPRTAGHTRIRPRLLLTIAALLLGSFAWIIGWIIGWISGGCPRCGVRPGGWWRSSPSGWRCLATASGG
ncbi:helix-turn-helix domain-containing protein [Streptomyces poriferorum]|uniref:Helix-turn-helix transcriptional regulator n=1 Tax=Streptomyces poriferorum TaxID=2798799 RepID=A0ABY9IJV4_9ACTN|nr:MULTISPECIES: helix-turn-helix transcriptional regulator [unclassified Streptomyces]MDP5316142.1 helix-turn-helix transcriptional regulator [Streptomyces sp. Alt4]WLQ54478.1 helix-turn-helix transcriptional regulator [Streptomyces sp. Alt2]